nr:unnamed protein product [Callosobruchus analis]
MIEDQVSFDNNSFNFAVILI